MSTEHIPGEFVPFTATQKQFDDFFEIHKVFIDTQLAEGITSFQPMLAVLSRPIPLPNQEAAQANKEPNEQPNELCVYLIAENINDHETKYALMDSLGGQVFKRGHVPIMVAFMCEAWLLTLATGEPYQRPSTSPKRQEALAIMAMTNTANVRRSGHIIVNRDAGKKMIPAGGWMVNDDGEQNLVTSFYLGYFKLAMAQKG